jgi:hypothetical protein
VVLERLIGKQLLDKVDVRLEWQEGVHRLLHANNTLSPQIEQKVLTKIMRRQQ